MKCFLYLLYLLTLSTLVLVYTKYENSTSIYIILIILFKIFLLRHILFIAVDKVALILRISDDLSLFQSIVQYHV